MQIDFYMILKKGSTYISKQHKNFKEASDEASRLANKEPDETFYILKCLGAKKVQTTRTEIECFRKDDLQYR